MVITATESASMHTIRNYSKRAYKTGRILSKRFTKQIMDALSDQPMNVTQLMIRLRCEQATLSQRLGKMRSYDLVSAERQGKNIIYSINTDRISKISQAVDRFING